MSPEELTQIRHIVETQFRLQLYKDIKFPYLQSLGIKHLVQGFHNSEKGFVGILHLYWVNEDHGIVYENPTVCPVKIKGIWKSEWLENHNEGEQLALKIRAESPVDGDKLGEVISRRIREVMNKNLNMALQDRVKDVLDKTKNEDEPEEGVLLN